MEIKLIVIFAISLLVSVGCGVSIIPAMLFGFLLFFTYGLKKGYSLGSMSSYAIKGIKTSSNVLITFLLIGMVTGIWRASGTIAYLVYQASFLCSPNDICRVTIDVTLSPYTKTVESYRII